MIRHSFSLAGISLLLATPSALAVDAQSLAQRLAGYGYTLSDAMEAGSTIIYGRATQGTLPIKGPIIFNNVTEGSDGSYHADTVIIATFENDSQGIKGTINNIQVSGLTLPRETAQGQDLLRTIRSFSTGSMTFSADGTRLFSADGFKVEPAVTMDNAAAATGYGVQIELTNAEATLELLDLADLADPVKELGLSGLKGNLRLGGFWDLAAGRLSISPVDLNLPEAAALTVSANLAGVTPALVGSIMQTNAQLDAARASGDQAAAAKLQEQLGVQALSQISLVRAEIAFGDKSVTDKLLNLLATQFGTDRNGLVGNVMSTLDTIFDDSTDKTRGYAALTAVQTFLTQPGIIRLRAEPAAPANLLTIMAMFVSSKGNTEPLLEMINFSITNS